MQLCSCAVCAPAAVASARGPCSSLLLPARNTLLHPSCPRVRRTREGSAAAGICHRRASHRVAWGVSIRAADDVATLVFSGIHTSIPQGPPLVGRIHHFKNNDTTNARPSSLSIAQRPARRSPGTAWQPVVIPSRPCAVLRTSFCPKFHPSISFDQAANRPIGSHQPNSPTAQQPIGQSRRSDTS